jgi:hypothetical protein
MTVSADLGPLERLDNLLIEHVFVKDVAQDYMTSVLAPVEKPRLVFAPLIGSPEFAEQSFSRQAVLQRVSDGAVQNEDHPAAGFLWSTTDGLVNDGCMVTKEIRIRESVDGAVWCPLVVVQSQVLGRNEVGPRSMIVPHYGADGVTINSDNPC